MRGWKYKRKLPKHMVRRIDVRQYNENKTLSRRTLKKEAFASIFVRFWENNQIIEAKFALLLILGSFHQ
jgi:hypothetical protein